MYALDVCYMCVYKLKYYILIEESEHGIKWREKFIICFVFINDAD